MEESRRERKDEDTDTLSIQQKKEENSVVKMKRCTYKRGIGEDDLRLVCHDVELDDVPIAVPVDHFRVCGKEARTF